MEKNAGYVIRESVLFDNKRGFAIAEHGNPKVPAPFVTWQFAEENGRQDYWGHYHADEASAQKISRIEPPTTSGCIRCRRSSPARLPSR